MDAAIAICPEHPKKSFIINNPEPYVASIGRPRCRICGMTMKLMPIKWDWQLGGWRLDSRRR